MARIEKAEHPRILHAVDVERRKVAEVAAEYGCTPANIYALLGKLRRAAEEAAAGVPGSGSPPTPSANRAERGGPRRADPPPTVDLFTAAAVVAAPALDEAVKPTGKRPGQAGRRIGQAPEADKAAARPRPARPDQRPPPKAPAAAAASAMVADAPRQGPTARHGGVGAALAKPGFGLVMRTAEGDENLTPFRSLEDLLSAVKPILRAAARSPDAIWFSIQPIDLTSLDGDAV